MNRRMLAEWENPKAILMAYPHQNSDWNYILPEAQNQFDRIINSLLDGGEKLILLSQVDLPRPLENKIKKSGSLILKDIPYNDTWTRDYGPITIFKNGDMAELDFGFNGWGLKFASDRDNLVNLNLVTRGYRNQNSFENHRDFILEGGSLETDGKGMLLTTTRCLCSDNRNGGKSKEEIEPILKEKLGVSRILWLDHGFLEGDDTDSHIDTLARLAPENTIVYVAPPKEKMDPHYSELKLMEEELNSFRTIEGKPFRCIPLPFPDPIYDENGERLPATYANYLVTSKAVYLPVYNQPENDRKAVEAIERAFPNHRIFTIDCRTLIKQHGSLHCSTMQLYY